MNKITELKTLQDLHDHKYAIFSPNPPLYLYEYIRDVGEIKRGTLQLAQAWWFISTPISPNEASNMRLNVHYQMSPSDLEFSRKVDMYPVVALFKDVRVFYLGDIGYELIKSSPEQVAKKYFGSSDFSKFFLYISNRADFNERMSLEYANKRNLVPPNALAAAKQVPLLGTHHHSLPPKMSTVQKYLKAAKQSYYDDVSRHSTLYDTMMAVPLTMASFGTYSRSPPMSAALGALSLVPLARIIHKYKKDIDKDETNVQRQLSEMVEVPREERDKLLTKGAMSAELMRHFSQHPHIGTRDTRKFFMNMHGRVHGKKGGSKKLKKNKTRKTPLH